jgi:hypothetical protein
MTYLNKVLLFSLMDLLLFGTIKQLTCFKIVYTGFVARMYKKFLMK